VIIGVPKEVKTREYRVGLVPAGAYALVRAGHRVLIETGAGLGAGIPDAEYASVGADIVAGAADVWAAAEMIVKVKEPIAAEYGRMRPSQIVYAYFHRVLLGGVPGVRHGKVPTSRSRARCGISACVDPRPASRGRISHTRLPRRLLASRECHRPPARSSP